MKKLVVVLFLALFSISFVLADYNPADCSPYKTMAVFDRPSNYSLDSVTYDVSIKESTEYMNSFEVTLEGVTYPPRRYNSSFETGTGFEIYLGKPFAGSPVMYTSIAFCMKAGEDLEDAFAGLTEEDGEEAAVVLDEIYGILDEDAQDTNYLLWGVIGVLALIIIYLLFRKKK